MWDCFGHTAIWVNMSVWRTSAGCSLCLSKYCKSIQLYCINEVVWWTGFEYNLDSITSLKDYVLEYIAKERRRIADVCFDKYKNRISDFLMENRWSDYVDWLWINQDQDLRDLTFCVQSHFFIWLEKDKCKKWACKYAEDVRILIFVLLHLRGWKLGCKIVLGCDKWGEADGWISL